MIASTIPIQTTFDLGVSGDAGNAHLQEQDFTRLLERSPPERIDATPAPVNDGVVAAAAGHLDAISRGLSVNAAVPLHGDVAPAAHPAAAVGKVELHGEIDQLLDGYSHLVAFSIKAQVTATGASSTTKTANQLMRGS
jgi:hypothetical protein